MVLPAAAARFWTQRVETMAVLAIAFGLVSSLSGLLLSYHVALPSGPAIILSTGMLYFVSVLFGTRGVLATRRPRHAHRIA
jgi:zinc/manganese transport system permease protein